MPTITIFRGVSKEEAVSLVAKRPGKRKNESAESFFERKKLDLADEGVVLARSTVDNG